MAAEDDILGARHKGRLNDIEQAIQKELFAAANAAHSLVDHSRRLQKCVSAADYAAKVRECFGDDGLHDFILGLRATIHHLHMIKAGWRIEHHSGNDKKASFTLNRDHLIAIVKLEKFSERNRASILACLTDAPAAIDLKRLFLVYQHRAAAFHAWYGETLASDALVEVRDYERCLQESRNFGERTWWKAMMGNWLDWKKAPNPYDHLHRFLSPDEIAEVYRLPMQSEAQVDRIIDFADTQRACDPDLRKMAYELFRRGTPPSIE